MPEKEKRKFIQQQVKRINYLHEEYVLCAATNRYIHIIPVHKN